LFRISDRGGKKVNVQKLFKCEFFRKDGETQKEENAMEAK